MTCTLPPAPDDKDLLEYADGNGDPKVAHHLEQCPHCRERAADLARWQGRLAAHLYRFTCPTPLELGEYHMELLDRDQAADVAQHLGECPHCSREVAQLKGYLGELAPSLEPSPLEQIKERARVVIARLVSGGEGNGLFGGPALAPAHAGLRGQEAEPYLYEADDMQIAIQVRDDAEQPGRKAILGLAMGPEPSGGLAFVWQAQRRVTVVPVDELGNFVIPDLDPGSYELILSGPRVEVHIQELQIGMN
jgi:hypothetical protein